MAEQNEDWQDRDELTQEELAEFKELLLQERDRVLLRLRSRVSDAVGESEAMSEEGDQAQQLTEQAYMLRLADKEQKLLKLIKGALRKFESQEYGFCEGTGDLINPARLRLRPWARYSIEYKEEQERERRGFARPTVSDDLPRLQTPRASTDEDAQLDLDRSLKQFDEELDEEPLED